MILVAESNKSSDESLLFDAIFIDVSGNIHEDGLSCPLPSFITEDALKKMYAALRERGKVYYEIIL